MNERPQNIPDSQHRTTHLHSKSLSNEDRSGLQHLIFLASELIRAPIAFITVLDGDHHRVGAQVGLPSSPATSGTLPSSLAICRRLILIGEPMIVNAAQDHEQGDGLEELFRGQSGSFVGFPLRSHEGQALGSFGVADFTPRSWQPGELGLLSELSALAVRELNAQVVARNHVALVEDHRLLSQRLVEAEKATADWEARLPRVQRLASLGTLACGVAHEFNNLLASIIGNATCAKFHALHGEIVMDPIDDILQASQRSREVVRQVLGYGRDQAAERQLIHLEPVLKQCASLLRSTIPRGVELSLSCNPETPPILGDSTQITQAVMNLVTNAWHALEHGSGRIEIALEPSTPTELAAGPHEKVLASHACVSVSDTGKGIDENLLPRIFEPFFTTKDLDEGAGLGLSIVQRILQEHGGLVRVRSQIGKGTVFTLLFPSAPQHPLTRS